jgi:type I restriction enzyme, S subunit
MGGDWPVVNVGDLADSISETHKFGKEQLIFLNTSDILSGKVLHQSYSTVRDWPGQAKKAIRKGDILFSEIRPANGRWAYVDFEAADYVVSTKLMVIRSKGELLLPRFLYHFLTSPETTRWLQHLAESRSGTFPQITFDQVASLEIGLPPLPVQSEIADFFDAVEGKIELNQRMNETLEDIAKSIFKSWFVDFDPVRAKVEGRGTGLPKNIAELFPDSFVDSELGEIPKNWSIRSLKELIEVKHGYAFEGEYFCDHITNDVLLTPGNFEIGGGFKEDKFKYYAGPVPGEFILNENDLLLSMTDLSKSTDTLGYPALIPHPPPGIHRFLHNQRLGKVIVSDYGLINTPFLFSLFCTKAYRQEILSGATGTTVKHTSPSRITAFKTVIPPPTLMTYFGQIATQFHLSIAMRCKQSRTLAMLRDTLLPKLFSGELRVKGADRFVANHI